MLESAENFLKQDGCLSVTLYLLNQNAPGQSPKSVTGGKLPGFAGSMSLYRGLTTSQTLRIAVLFRPRVSAGGRSRRPRFTDVEIREHVQVSRSDTGVKRWEPHQKPRIVRRPDLGR